MERVGGRTARITGTAILAALVIVFDYALKFSGLKIPFLWMPFLMVDFTGVPIVVALLLIDLGSSATTSVVAALGIVARSGDVLGGAMKGIAEFSTVAGIVAGRRVAALIERGGTAEKALSLVAGVLFRVVIMSCWNLVVLPYYYGLPLQAAVGMLPLLAVFNGMQGAMTVILGYLLFEAYVGRASASGQ
jgi:riboflavin transporter FmnP